MEPSTKTDGTDPATRSAHPSALRPWAWVAVFALVATAGGVVGGLLIRMTTSSSTGDARACDATTVAETVLPSVVTIRTRTGDDGGNGSGQLIRDDGSILTNDHVIAAAADQGEISVRYSDGVTSPAVVVGRDPLTDLAVLDATDGAEGRPVITVGSSSALEVGQPVVALGAPLGLSSTVTTGVVSTLDRYVPVPQEDGLTAHLVDAIQTDASINPGNSGGALVDCDGALVGVNSAIATVPNASGVSGGGSVGLGFAIPVDLAMPLADELIEHGRVDHLTFGLQAQPIGPAAARETGLPAGLFVTVVDPGGPAAQAGIQEGDVITTIEGQPATSVAELEVLTLTRDDGDTVEVTYQREGTSTTTSLTLARP